MVSEDFLVPPCDVLVVDDQLFHRDMVTEMLRTKGLRVEHVGSADEALAAYVKLEVKPVVLMDNRMPSMTGVEATRALKSLDEHAKVVFVSSDVSHRDEAMAAGALGFVTKPFKIAEVFAAVSWALAYKFPEQAAAGP
jgi:CheY-like chemotaxis protein